MENEIDPTQPLSIVNADPAIKFLFFNKTSDMNPETAVRLVEVELDGWNFGSVNKKQWQEIIDFCQKQIS